MLLLERRIITILRSGQIVKLPKLVRNDQNFAKGNFFNQYKRTLERNFYEKKRRDTLKVVSWMDKMYNLA